MGVTHGNARGERGVRAIPVHAPEGSRTTASATVDATDDGGATGCLGAEVPNATQEGVAAMSKLKFRMYYKGKLIEELTLAEIAHKCEFHWADEVNVVQYINRVDNYGEEIYDGDIIVDDYSRGAVCWDGCVNAWAWPPGEEWGMIPKNVTRLWSMYED